MMRMGLEGIATESIFETAGVDRRFKCSLHGVAKGTGKERHG
jgi:hypothetical protein